MKTDKIKCGKDERKQKDDILKFFGNRKGQSIFGCFDMVRYQELTGLHS